MMQEVDLKDGSIFQVGKRNTWQREGKQWIRLRHIETNAEYQFTLARTDRLDKPIGYRDALNARLRLRDGRLLIGADGYEGAADTTMDGFPIALDLCGQKLHLMVWADVNTSIPTHVISLEGARENALSEPRKKVLEDRA